MKIEGVYESGVAFLIETTGARYEYVTGKLTVYQGLDETNRRLLSTIFFESEPNFVKVEANEDHVLFWSQDVNLGFYGDSTCIISPKTRQQLKCKGNFKPDYEGRYKGELLLIDDLGGMEIYPQRHETDYRINKIELGKSNWIADYQLNAGERVMVAAFPGKPFDWDKSFESHVVITTGGFGEKHPYRFGQMPEDSVIEKWSKFLDIIAVQHNGLWSSGKPSGPYVVHNKPEFRRLIATAHRYGMKVIAYCSLYYHYRIHKDFKSFYQQIKTVFDEYGIDGVYIDGLLVDAEGHYLDNKITNWEMTRRLRKLFGADGAIVYHGTSLGTPVATVPNIDSYCDATLNCETVYFKSTDDPYIKYQVRKYGISNTIGLWIRNKKPDDITKVEIIDAMLEMNCREWFNGYQFWKKTKPDPIYKYYLKKLEQLKQSHIHEIN